jgi:DNA gyrase/topoisomerase IV subunit B
MTGQDIKILNDVEHCILRSEMYIGSKKITNQPFWILNDNQELIKENLDYIPGEYKIFCEIVDNCVDEHIKGHGDRICIEYNQQTGFITVSDNARGIPIEIHKDAKIPTPQVVFTQLRSGSNFSDDNRMSVGMNGVGASLTAIFSEQFTIEIKRDNKIYTQKYENNLSKISKPKIVDHKSRNTGTKIIFKPDSKIFQIPINPKLIVKRCFELSYMFPKIEFKLEIINADNTIKTYNFYNPKFEELIKKFSDEFSIYESVKDGIRIAICKNKEEIFDFISNVNGADTYRGGTHIDYFKDVFISTIKEKIKKENKLEITTQDVSKNMFMIVLLNWKSPVFEGQTKEKLVNDRKDFENYFNDLFSTRRINIMLNNLPKMIEKIVTDVNEKNDIKLLSEIKKKQKNLDRKRIPKLIECSHRDRNKCSLYITEGDSAISNLSMVRDSKLMAGLPLRGKILNVHESPIKDVVDNKELQSIMAVVGLKIGERPIKPHSDGFSHNLNYGKIIIATDQDMDGYAIRCLLINFFYKFWPELFEYGMIYILESPLYEVIDKNKNVNYFYNKGTFEEYMKGRHSSAYEISYFKGLGSCGTEAWDYMLNQNPNLIKVSNDSKSKESLKLAFGDDPTVRKVWLST